MRLTILLLSLLLLSGCPDVCEDADGDGQGDPENCIADGEEGYKTLLSNGGVWNSWDCDDDDASLLTWFPDTDGDDLGETGHDCAEPVCDTEAPSTWSCASGRPQWADNALDQSYTTY